MGKHFGCLQTYPLAKSKPLISFQSLHTRGIVLLRKLIYGLKKRHHLQSHSLTHCVWDFISRLDPWAPLALSNKRHHIKDAQKRASNHSENDCVSSLFPGFHLTKEQSGLFSFYYFLLCAWTLRCTAMDLIHRDAVCFHKSTDNTFFDFFFYLFGFVFLILFFSILAWWRRSIRGFDDLEGLRK